MATFNHISGAEPSTVTFKAATVTQTRNSSVMHQEIISIGDPDSSLAIGAVLNTDPASTAWGLVTRDVRYSTIVSVAAMPANSSLVQVSAFSAALISSAAVAANSSALNVRVVGGASSAADFKVTTTPVSTGWVKQAGFSVDSSNYLNVNASFTGSTIVTVSTIVGVVTVRPESTANSSAYLAVRLTDGTAFAALQADYVHGSSLTPSTIAAPSLLYRASSTTPPPVSTSDLFAVAWGTLNGAGVQTLVTSSGESVMDSSTPSVKVSIVSGAAAGSTGPLTVRQLLDSSGGSVTAADSANNAIRVNVVAGAAGGSTIVTVSAFGAGMISSGVPAAGTSGLVVQQVGYVAPSTTVSVAAFPANSSLVQLNAIAAGYVSTAAAAANSSALNVRVVGHGSSAADFPVLISGNSTVVVSAFAAALISSGVPPAGTSGLVVQQVGYVAPSTTVSVAALPANSSQVEVRAFPVGVLSTATPATGSTGVSVYLANQSTIVTIAALPANTSNVAVTAFPSGLISSGAASSGSSAVNIRNVIDGIVTAVSTSAFAASTLFSLVASTAQQKYVTAYSFTSTDQTPTVLRFMSGSTVLWAVRMIAVSSGLTGANMATGPGGGGYLFRGNAGSSLSLNINGSSRAGWTVSVAYYLAP